jgi:transcriptional regulator with XRE-family HTH domain
MVSIDPALEALGEYIRMQRQLSKLSLRQMARAAGLSDSYLSQVERGLYRPSAEVLKAIADALKLSATSLYTQIGLLDEPAEDGPGVAEAIRRDTKLRPDQKEALLHMYMTLIGT